MTERLKPVASAVALLLVALAASCQSGQEHASALTCDVRIRGDERVVLVVDGEQLHAGVMDASGKEQASGDAPLAVVKRSAALVSYAGGDGVSSVVVGGSSARRAVMGGTTDGVTVPLRSCGDLGLRVAAFRGDQPQGQVTVFDGAGAAVARSLPKAPALSAGLGVQVMERLGQ